ncbi:hypothetical protein QO239_03740 [Cupriavidus taiwanensis]|uniref:hypothetical protein n=1 Tax=Cupriavidus taiwanensis TaxID=164546 RepID=UPI0025416645|nr:hypothetical protein [Cupriavidus taiwanensis]MDK3021718.1 hypothetical protein [Cupriavidus taiwanensis]
MAGAWFERLVKRSEPLTTEPPADLAARIDEATLMPSPHGDKPRCIVMLQGLRGFYFDPDSAGKALRRLAPEMNDEQTARAVAHLAARVATAQRNAERPLVEGDRPRWRDWRPLEL